MNTKPVHDRFRRVPWLVLSLLASTSACAAPTMIDHVNGYTLDSAGKVQRFEAMLIDDGKVVATGSSADLASGNMKERAKNANVIDGKGRTLLPGLIDSHGHVMGLGAMKLQADLVGTTSVDEALARVSEFAKAHPESAWVTGRGWNQVIWNLGRFPTAKELDKAVSDRPVFLSRVDGHAGWANSVAMQRAGIDKTTRDPSGGRIERDAEGNPNGVFVDGAMDLITSKIPPPTALQVSAALDASLAEMARVGLTGVADAGIDANTYRLYRRYADQGRLTTRIYAMIGGVGDDFDTISKDGPLIGYANDFLSVRSVKLYADGALGSRGAAMLAPYSDDPKNSGLLFDPPALMTAKLGKALSRNYQVCVHAIGDAANREVLDSFEAAYKKHGGEQLRNPIEHAQVLTLDDINRFVPLKLIASMQPTHATSDMNMAEERVGSERIAGGYAWQRFLKQHTVVAGGSDFPVESPNPFFGIHAAVTRQDHTGKPPSGWYPSEAMSLTEALRAFTLDGAYAEHAEKTLGTLEPGKWADFIFVDRDIFAVPSSELWATVVEETWVGGKQVFAKSPSK
ncbi:MAG: amidohydrolase family protein [Dokdonella sp.]